MHRLLKRQLKKIAAQNDDALNTEQFTKLLALVNQAYMDADDDRLLLENSLDVSSNEMQGLYKQLQQTTKSKIQQSEEKYKRLVRNLKHYYFFYTRNTLEEFTYVSDSVSDMLGYKPNEFALSFKSYLTDDPQNDIAQEKSELVLQGKEIPPYVVQLYDKNEILRHLEVLELPIFDENGVVTEVEGIVRDISEHTEVRKQLDHIALHDALTGIPNRFYLHSQLDKLIDYAAENDTSFALLFLDLDNFKTINDSLGHSAGDKLLQSVVQKVKPAIRNSDIFARIGGDEFIIVLTDIQVNNVKLMIDRIMSAIRLEWSEGDFVLNITSSIGVAIYPDDGQNTTSLMKHADIAMYEAKKNGRNNCHFFTDELNDIIQKEIRLEQDMVKALENDEFMLYFQPKVQVDNNQIIGAEALIRWQHPELGFVSPNDFIPLAETTGLIIKIGKWVIEESCRALVRINKVNDNKLNLALNLSNKQIENDKLYTVLKNAIELNNVDASQISLEMTESVMVQNTELALKRVTKIKTLGITLCMDDFGTGYSSLSYLHQFPIDTLKIDKAFVDQIKPCGTQAVLLDTILAMGSTLNLDIVAEGVEQEYQRQYLLSRGCPCYQGYLFSKPLCESEFLDLIRKHDSSISYRPTTSTN